MKKVNEQSGCVNRRRFLESTGLAAGAIAAGALSRPAVAAARGHDYDTRPSLPNIVLVHGGWADGSSWARVIDILGEYGYPIYAVPVPLTSIASDVAFTQRFVASQQITGPTVLVGHSYGGIVIGEVANQLPNVDVKALVFAAAFALDIGESIGQVLGQFPGPGQPQPAGRQYFRTDVDSAGNPDPNGYTWIDRAHYRFTFCADVPQDTAQVMDDAQRPISNGVFSEQATVAAWRSFPCYYQISKNDRVLGPDAEAFFAERLNAKTIALHTSHASIVAKPVAIAKLIVAAANG
jgi:pimeloyl-ACP methyl ester carboxylesterase